LKVQWCPEQIAAEVPISHETIYRHIYADKALGGVFYRQLRCQKSDVIGMPAAEIEKAK
jgi:IS30 family transposase